MSPKLPNAIDKNQAVKRLLLIAVVGSVTMLTGCASLLSNDTDPLAEYRTAVMQKADSRAQFDEMIASNHALRNQMRERVYGPPRVRTSVTSDGDEEEAVDLDRVQVTGSRILASDVITNVQTAGIDEGGIVKRVGDVLIVLSGSVLHTVLLREQGADSLRLVQSLDLKGTEDKSDTWFDEIIAFSGGVLLLSYNYDQNLTEIWSIAMTVKGELTESGRVQIRADDYFSGSNYGLRLVDDRVLFPVSVSLGRSRSAIWPMWRSRDEAGRDEWQPLLEPEDILLPLTPVHHPTVYGLLQCDLDALLSQQMDCRSTALVAEFWSELYVGPNAAYVALDAWHDEAYLQDDFSPWGFWLSGHDTDRTHLRRTLIYRFPLNDGESPGVVSINGLMGNQFSMVEANGYLTAVTEIVDPNQQRLLETHRVAESDFSDQLPGQVDTFARIPVSNSHRTIRVAEQFVLVGEHGAVLREDEEFGRDTEFIIQPIGRADPVRVLLPQSIDRLELVGSKVFLSGQDSLGHWALRLIDPKSPHQNGFPATVPNYISGEDRSHAFNWQRLSSEDIILGLPGIIRDENEPVTLPSHWIEETSDLLFFTARGLDLSEAGVLDMQADNAPGDYCDEDYGCYDWYGNARAIFIDDRIFALSGNRLDEGHLIAGRVQPIRSIFLVHR